MPALAVSGPCSAVKEQSSGLDANGFTRRGYVALAFAPSFTGESGGTVRDVGSPDMYTEDFSAAIDFLGLQKMVDRERIGVQGMCGLSGMALTAAAADSRIKAVVTSAMFDMSRSMSRGYQDSYTREQRQKVIDYLSRQRWTDAEKGTYAWGSHEVPFGSDGNVAPLRPRPAQDPPGGRRPDHEYLLRLLPHRARLPPHSINSTTVWTATTPMSFFAFQQMTNIDMLAPRKALLVTGSNAHTRATTPRMSPPGRYPHRPGGEPSQVQPRRQASRPAAAARTCAAACASDAVMAPGRSRTHSRTAAASPFPSCNTPALKARRAGHAQEHDALKPPPPPP
ncbi:alpha/beta hydrolase, partial [Streptomyces cinerochromogenes]|uniref:alpha/beta hydrolase n=1 Tax=Streptomyces cinerochromogenes TaxID=66422 RepID=UPI003570AA2D